MTTNYYEYILTDISLLWSLAAGATGNCVIWFETLRFPGILQVVICAYTRCYPRFSCPAGITVSVPTCSSFAIVCLISLEGMS